MKFCWSTLRTKNLDDSIRFYSDIVGLKVVERFTAGPGMEIAFLASGETKIELICDGSDRDINVGNDISWGFEVESLDKTLGYIREKGINIDGGPFQPNPHIRYFFIQDPNGMRLQIVENIR
ncbi:lactoylglutathione lyase [Anaerobacterium chartisolvens]|uniref:Lactoylglutathione lyase n=1 Tax=Anaerobacterium chartisolvens TaxID=1297424 RepID=A0A369AUU9_9FIRM|nr:VOC family protein [Anaerobacterium chartisolvens]RCX12981.1 lactoylglutathione lyase [Anaerobacterium chartisolvens]